MIRRALVDDAAAIALVQATSWRETYVDLLPERVIAARTNADKLSDATRRRMESNLSDHRVFVAQERGSVCGFIWTASSEEIVSQGVVYEPAGLIG